MRRKGTNRQHGAHVAYIVMVIIIIVRLVTAKMVESSSFPSQCVDGNLRSRPGSFFLGEGRDPLGGPQPGSHPLDVVCRLLPRDSAGRALAALQGGHLLLSVLKKPSEVSLMGTCRGRWGRRHCPTSSEAPHPALRPH